MKIKSFMKVLNVGKYAAMAALLMGTMAACSDDDDDDNGGGNNSQFETPKYEVEAAKYVIDDQRTSPYKSIELTASGNFIIQPSEYVNNAPQKVPVAKGQTIAQRMIKMIASQIPVSITRYDYVRPSYGKYTKTGENHYNLEGFGTLTVNKDANGTVRSIVLTTAGKYPEEYTAHKQNMTIHNSTISNNLCRTWHIESFRFYEKMNGKIIIDFKANTISELVDQIEQWSKKNYPDFDEEDEASFDEMRNIVTLKEIVFTKAGTYFFITSDNEWNMSEWVWENENEGLLRHSWINPDDGVVRIEFNNNKLHFTFGDFDYEDGESYEEGLTYIMTEVK